MLYKLSTVLFITILTSCGSSENDIEKGRLTQKQVKDSSLKLKDDATELIVGIWQIDSTKQVGKSLIEKPDSFQGFVFKQNGSFATTEKYGNAVAESEIGNYTLNDDSLIVFSKNGDQLMGYSIVKISNKELSLSGGPSGGNPIMFFLSKFNERKNP